MKVKQVLEQLQQLAPELEILCYTEDNNLLPKNHGLRLLDITDISILDGERTRGEDQIPSVKIGKSASSERIAIIEVTADF